MKGKLKLWTWLLYSCSPPRICGSTRCTLVSYNPGGEGHTNPHIQIHTSKDKLWIWKTHEHKYLHFPPKTVDMGDQNPSTLPQTNCGSVVHKQAIYPTDQLLHVSSMPCVHPEGGRQSTIWPNLLHFYSRDSLANIISLIFGLIFSS